MMIHFIHVYSGDSSGMENLAFK